MMKKLLLVLVSLYFAYPGVSGSEFDSLFQVANAHYTQASYEEAQVLYEQLAEEGYKVHALYYNLGNSYYKTNRLAQAVWAYERALLLNPGDDNIRYNLGLVNAQLKDDVQVLPVFFLKRWFYRLIQWRSSNFWAFWSLLFFVFAVGALFFYFYSSRVTLIRAAFFSSILLLLMSAFLLWFAFRQKQMLLHNPYAILYEPVVNVKSAPSQTSTDLFVLHEGIKVEVLNEVQAFSLIRLTDGNQGWLPSAFLQPVGFSVDE